jgi:hypothetical protein
LPHRLGGTVTLPCVPVITERPGAFGLKSASQHISS